MRKLPILCLALLALSGCASQGGGWNPLSAWFGRKAAAEARTEAKAGKTEDATVKAAQKEVEKAKVAAAVAAAEHPESRAIEVVNRTVGNASALLNQRSPLTVAELEEAVATAKGLLSVESAKREQAERNQAATERDNRNMAEELGALRAKLTEQAEGRKAEAAANLATANELRAANIWKWTSTAASALFAAGMLAYRANAFGIATRVAGGLADLEKAHGTGTADLARGALDSALDSGDKNKIFAALKTIAPAIAQRVSAS
jgi:NADH dehydrogenase/NADH:ubiquinone oxidoreductase subunit G